jgi:uncharacterized protein
MKLLVISDTHVPDFAPALPGSLLVRARRADSILHAGDVTSSHVLEDLSEIAPAYVALGNNDGDDVAVWSKAAERVEVQLDGVAIGMVHDAGPRTGRAARLRRWFPEADLIIFGHSHIPLTWREHGAIFLNPGSPTWKRRQPKPTLAWVSGRAGRLRVTISELSA